MSLASTNQAHSPLFKGKHMSKITYNESPICADCAGCCKMRPGGYSPEQIDPKDEDMLIKHGIIEWDYHQETFEVFDDDGDYSHSRFKAYWYLRPTRPKANKGCIFLTQDGCSLSWGERPYECKALTPAADWDQQCNSELGHEPMKALGILWFLSGRGKIN